MNRLLTGLCLGLLWAASSAGWADGPAPLDVQYSDNRLSVRADQVSQAAVLRQVAAITGIDIQFDPGFSGPVGHWALRGVPLEEALLQLARPSNVLIFHGARDPGAQAAPVVAVHVLAPRASTTNDADVASVSTQAKSPWDRAQDLVQIIQTSGDWYRRQQAIAALGALPRDVASSGLESALAVPEPILRQDIVRALGGVYGETPPTVLGQVVMGDSNAQVRLTALQALAGIDSPVARQFIQQALQDPETFIQEIARDILGRLDTH